MFCIKTDDHSTIFAYPRGEGFSLYSRQKDSKGRWRHEKFLCWLKGDERSVQKKFDKKLESIF